MTFLGLAFCVALMAFAAVSVPSSLALRPVLRRAVSTAESRVGTLFALRYTPTLLALLFTGLFVLPAFLQLEPRKSGERISSMMIALAAASFLALAAGPLHGLRSALATARLERRWRRGATAISLPGAPVPAFAIDEEFPLVAVVGVLRPRLYVARRVLRNCTAPEMAAIVAHETAHHQRLDNLKRLLLCSCPDLLAFTAGAGELERAWSERCDRAADDYAARRGSGVELAAALVKVARALDAPAPAGGMLAAFCRGDDIADRVRRLLHPPSTGTRRADRLLPILLLGSVLAGFLLGRGPDVRLAVHGLTESVVRLLQ
jgi:peptidase M48-like protein